MASQSRSRDNLLIMKNKVSKEVTVIVKDPAETLSSTKASLPVYDEKGQLLGYVALFATATL
jgi:hypothetical protein